MKLTAFAIVLGMAWTVAAGRAAAQTPDGQAVFHDECRKCHGVAGKPTHFALSLYKEIPTFDAKFLAGIGVDSIVAVLDHGAGKNMKPFKGKLTPAEIAAVAAYVKQTFGAPTKS